VIACRFGLDGEAPQTLLEVARRLGLSKERVRQIEVSALASLRVAIEEHTPRGRQPHRRVRDETRGFVATLA
jgi:DNA-directed RNA polymerase sigma subunit (sigma70/sigma32)